MPLFSYQCLACGHSFEALLPRLEGANPQSCPSCGKEGAERSLSLPARGRVVDAARAAGPCGEGPPCGAPGCRRVS